MSKPPTSTTTYHELAKFIRAEIEASKRKIENAKITTYWRIGQAISKHLLYNKNRAGYGDHLFERLAEDLDVGKSTLHNTVQFYRQYPIIQTSGQLGWSHYQTLLTLKDDDKRAEWEERAIKKGFSARELKRQIQLGKEKTRKSASSTPHEIVQLKIERGALYTYSLIESDKIETDFNTLLADLGFNVWRKISKKDHNTKTTSSAAQYTYKAFVEEVIDGDTLWCQIELGFNSFTRQKLRLRSIDCAEVTTPEGQKAKAFVKRILGRCAFIIVKTNKSDLYDRYLADIFYAENEKDPARVAGEGVLLNQTLLDKGLAVLWE